MDQPSVNIGLLFLISGPAGSGKTTLCHRLIESQGPQVQRVVTATTRSPRTGEINHKDYHFLSKEEFEQKIKENAFYEYACVHRKHFYGTLKQEIKEKLENNIDLLINIDVQGFNAFREIAKADPFLRKRLVSIFILPPNLEVLKERLTKRNLDQPEIIEARLKTAQEEIEACPLYDHCIHTKTKEEDFANFLAIYKAEKARLR